MIKNKEVLFNTLHCRLGRSVLKKISAVVEAWEMRWYSRITENRSVLLFLVCLGDGEPPEGKQVEWRGS